MGLKLRNGSGGSATLKDLSTQTDHIDIDVRNIGNGGISWKAGVNYKSGDIVSEADLVYITSIDHSSLINDVPNGSPSQSTQTNWSLVNQERAGIAWVAGKDYFTGDAITENEILYLASNDHTSETGDTANGSPDQFNQVNWKISEAGKRSNTNLIMNGSFQINQELGFAGTRLLDATGNDNGWLADLFDVIIKQNINGIGSGKLFCETVLEDNMNSLKISVDTPISSLNDIYVWPMEYAFNPVDILFLQGGDATLSFKFKGSTPGRYSVSLVSYNAGDSSYVTYFDYTTAHTIQKVSITIPIPVFTGLNAIVKASEFYLYVGTISSVAGWEASVVNDWDLTGGYRIAPGSVNWGATAGNYVQFYQMQFEQGSESTGFEIVSYGEDLARVQRYYVKFGTYGEYVGAAPGTTGVTYEIPIGNGVCGGGDWIPFSIMLPQPMRAAPSMIMNPGPNAGGDACVFAFANWNWCGTLNSATSISPLAEVGDSLHQTVLIDTSGNNVDWAIGGNTPVPIDSTTAGQEGSGAMAYLVRGSTVAFDARL